MKHTTQWEKEYLDRLNSLISKRNGWFSSEDFDLLLTRERGRMRRSGSRSCVVVFDLSASYQQAELYSSRTRREFLVRLLKVINDNSRSTDIKSITNSHKIRLLLLDTDSRHAQYFLQKLTKKLSERVIEVLDIDEWNILNSLVKLYYPLNDFDGQTDWQSVPLPVTSSPDRPSREQPDPLLSLQIDGLLFRSETSGRTSNRSFYENAWPFLENSDYTALLASSLPAAMLDSQKPVSAYYLFGKRSLDLVGSSLGLLLFLPLMVLVVLAIKLTSRGPVFFKQTRVGHLGKCFTLYKFRTMKTDNDPQVHRHYVEKLIRDNEPVGEGDGPNGKVYKLSDDTRITKVGKLLRKTSVDELPQFLNVLKGDMSLVGPRPPIPYEVKLYQAWHLRRVMEARPGLTGLWQIYGRNKSTFDEMVRYDLRYIKCRSFWLDLKLIIKTIPVLFNIKAGL